MRKLKDIGVVKTWRVPEPGKPGEYILITKHRGHYGTEYIVTKTRNCKAFRMYKPQLKILLKALFE